MALTHYRRWWTFRNYHIPLAKALFHTFRPPVSEADTNLAVTQHVGKNEVRTIDTIATTQDAHTCLLQATTAALNELLTFLMWSVGRCSDQAVAGTWRNRGVNTIY
jgi:hypothetical protein